MGVYDDAIAGLRGVEAQVDAGPLLGYGDDVVTGPAPIIGGFRTNPIFGEAPTAPEQIYTDTVLEVIQGLDPEDRNLLALEMFVALPGVYSDVDHIYDDSGELDQYYFAQAVDRALSGAATFGPEAFGSGTGENSEYLQVLMRDTEMSPEELMLAFQNRKAEIARQKGGGGGRVINYIDPVALAATAKDAFSEVTGRKATTAEQRAFVKQIHGLQASGASGIQVGPRAQEFARGEAGVEAKSMDYSNAASALMAAMGMG